MKKLSREELLAKTHYGLTIYTHIMRELYPDETALSFTGGDYNPCKNPFNNDRETLWIKDLDGCMMHVDTECAIPHGDAFDFAAMHYKLNGDDLLEKINKDMNLRIGIGNSEATKEQKPSIKVQSVLSRIIAPSVSYFNKPVSNTIPTEEVNITKIYEFIKGDKYESCTTTLRGLDDAKKAREYKAKEFDYVTFSGTFEKRGDHYLKIHSGLMVIDFDHLKNVNEIKKKLLADPYFETELLFVSPSGNGLKWIIKVDLEKHNHEDNFIAVSNYLEKMYNLKVDQSGKDISRACFLPHDPKVFINNKYINDEERIYYRKMVG